MFHLDVSLAKSNRAAFERACQARAAIRLMNRLAGSKQFEVHRGYKVLRGIRPAVFPGTGSFCPKVRHMHRIPDVFEIPSPGKSNPLPWLTALAIAAIIIGGTLALVVSN